VAFRPLLRWDPLSVLVWVSAPEVLSALFSRPQALSALLSALLSLAPVLSASVLLSLPLASPAWA